MIEDLTMKNMKSMKERVEGVTDVICHEMHEKDTVLLVYTGSGFTAKAQIELRRGRMHRVGVSCGGGFLFCFAAGRELLTFQSTIISTKF